MSAQVWVLDDNPAVAESVVTLLLSEGISALALTDTSLTLRLLQRGEHPQVLVTDLHMPEDGNDLVRTILENPKWTFPIIVLSGWEDGVERDLRGRVMRILPKTTEPLELVRVVRRALGQRV